jgi:Ethanolamine utilization protein EutJ (predicted chaperonin)
VDRDELPQIAAFDFAFVQHDVPVVDCMGALSATRKDFDAPS